MEETPSEIDELPVEHVRKRGRPKGSLNKKTLEKMAPVQDQEEDPIEEESPEPPPAPKRKARARAPSPASLDEETPQPAPKRKARARAPSPSSSLEEEPPKRPRTRPQTRVRSPPPRQPVRTKATPVEPPTYLEVLTRTLEAARAQDRVDRLTRYDHFFSA